MTPVLNGLGLSTLVTLRFKSGTPLNSLYLDPESPATLGGLAPCPQRTSTLLQTTTLPSQCRESTPGDSFFELRKYLC